MMLKELDADLYNFFATIFLAIGLATLIWLFEEIYHRKKVSSLHLVALVVIIISLISVMLIAKSYANLAVAL
jgi:hypothetical protein